MQKANGLDCDALLFYDNRMNVIVYILFTQLPWPGDIEGTFWFSSRVDTCLPVYHTTRWRLHIVSLIPERQVWKQ